VAPVEAVAPSDTEVGEAGVGDSGVSSPSFTESMIDGDSGGDDAVLSPDTNVLSGSLGSGSDQDLDSDPFQAIGRDGTSADEGGRASSFLDVDGLVEVDSDFDWCASKGRPFSQLALLHVFSVGGVATWCARLHVVFGCAEVRTGAPTTAPPVSSVPAVSPAG
jgi:hypothetical protein